MFSLLFSARPLPARQMGLLTVSLLLGLALALLPGRWFSAQQAAGQALRDNTLRLHIRADSDSVRDQTLKLRVRDALLELSSTLWGESTDQQQALACAARNLARLQLAAQQTLARWGVSTPVRLSLQNMYFDTTQYDGFALPAGRYDALRVDLGDPVQYGKNWWCVLYPGLCLSAFSGYDSPDQQDLICGEYILRFRAVELWQSLTASREDRVLLAVE